MDYPIPTHLKEILVVDEKASDIHDIEGSLRCTCGCKKFLLRNFADYYNAQPCVARKNDGYAFVIKAVCADCGNEWVVFDLSKHGYNGFVCKDGLTVDDSELEKYLCSKCFSEYFFVKIGIEVENKEQFIEECVTEYPDEFSPEDYINAFNWITISVKCCHCEIKNDDWVSLELS